MTGCLVVLVIYALHVEGIVVAVVVEHKGSHVEVGERMTTSKMAVLYTFTCGR